LTSLPIKTAQRPPMPQSDLLTELLKAVWRQRVIALLAATLGLSIPAAMVLNVQPQYEATALVHVARMSGQEVAGGRFVSAEGGDPIAIRTEVEILSSDAISRSVVEGLRLASNPAFQPVSPVFSLGGLLRAFLGTTSSQPDEPETAGEEANRLLDLYRRGLSVANDDRSAIAAISYTSASPTLARDIANAHARAYLASRAARRLEATEVSESRIVSPATLPSSPTSRQTTLFVIIGLGFAAGLGIAAALLADFLSPKYWNLQHFSAALGLRPLVSVPFEPGIKVPRSSLLKGLLAERVRALANLVLDESQAGIDTFLVVSALPGEGADVLAVWLGQALAAKDISVGIVEGDLRAPTLARMLKTPAGEGIGDWLAGTARLRTIEQQGQGVYVLPGGSNSQSAVDRLSAERVKDILAFARSSYAVTLVTAPPLLPAPEGLLFAARCQRVILVSSSRKTDQQFIEQAVDILHGAGAQIMGLVLIGADEEDAAMLKNRALRDYYHRRAMAIDTASSPPPRPNARPIHGQPNPAFFVAHPTSPAEAATPASTGQAGVQ